MTSLTINPSHNSNQTDQFWMVNSKLVYIFIVMAILSYLILGAYPVVPLENDGMRMALGIQGNTLYGDYTYSYDYVAQAGIYKIVGFLSEVLNIDPFYAFSLTTLVSSVVFILFASNFLSRLLNVQFLLAFLSLIIFQEVYVSGYYPNSAMLAAAFLSIALFLSSRKEHFRAITLSAVCFAIATWCRIDSVLMGLTFLILLFNWTRRSIFSILLFGFVFLSVIITLYILSGVSLRSFIEQLSGSVGQPSDISRTLRIYSTIFTFASICFMLYGIFQLLKSRHWRLLLLTLLAPLPLICAYGTEIDSPKKNLYDMILYTIPIIYGLNSIFNNRSRTANIVLLGGVILVIGQFIFTPAYELIFSRSLIIYTADEPRLRGAIAYTPIYWANYRHEILIKDFTFQKKLTEYLQQHSPAYLISQDWMANQWLLYFLQSQSYQIKETENYATILEDGQRLILTKGPNIVYLVRWRPETSLDLPDRVQKEVKEAISILYIGPDYTTTNYAQNSFLANKFEGQHLNDWGRFEAILFQR